MTLDKDLTWERLDDLWHDPSIKTLPTKGQRYALLSDIHLGDGGGADDFVRNTKALVNALDYYAREGYQLILLGDIEELWQFDLPKIKRQYDSTVYQQIRSFGDGRVIRIFGNHDNEWEGMVDPTRAQPILFGFADEAVKLMDGAGNVRILLVHGHQGSVDADKFSWFSRFFVRLYSGIEPLIKLTGAFGHSSATKSQIAKDYERTFYSWAKRNRVILICGHSHRAIFEGKSYGERIQEKINECRVKMQSRGVTRAEKQQLLQKIEVLERELEDEKDKNRTIDAVEPGGIPLPCYFNTGCGLYSDGMTSIEIDDDEMRLVKWSKYELSTETRTIFYAGKISDYVAALSAP
jgi:UDP-2,3-diacylglucosamine pyrophosphatase LpxH